ncbi:phage transcriptional regulator, ArpU family protein [Streptococcus pneumoniae 2070335]|nr:phage transcriptional regulator, ArpU family protein [Streptococcus pneumoniae 2070335]
MLFLLILFSGVGHEKSQHTADLHGMVSHNYYIMRRSSCANRVIGYHRRKENQKGSYQSTKKYSRLRRIAGEEYAPKITISYSLEPRSSSGQTSKQVESMVVRRVSAQQDLELIAKAINNLSDMEYTRILIERYCRKKRREDYSIYSELGYSSSEYYRILNKALLEFAESYQASNLLVYK